MWGVFVSCFISVAFPIATKAAETIVNKAQDGTAQESLAIAPAVTVIKIEERELVSNTIVSGTLVPRDDVVVVPEVEGLIVTELLADEGDTVVKGKVLARLNSSALEIILLQNKAQLARIDATIAQSKAQIAEAEANKLQANNAFARSKSLMKTGSTSADIMDQKTAASDAANARLASAKQVLEIALADRASAMATMSDTALRLERTEIKAPVDGVVYRRNAKLGAPAAAVGEPMFRMIANGLVELDAEVSELDMSALRQGQPVQVTVAGLSRAVTGRIRLVSPEVDKSTRLGKVRIALDKDISLQTGGFARGVIETGRKTAVSVPLSAITYSRAGPLLQSVVDEKIVSRPVQLGLIGGGRAEIISGAAIGDVIVARAGTFVRDGDRIRAVVTNVDMTEK